MSINVIYPVNNNFYKVCGRYVIRLYCDDFLLGKVNMIKNNLGLLGNQYNLIIKKRPISCANAALIARHCANTQSSRRSELNSVMCWTGVAYCALLSGIIDRSTYDQLKCGGERTMVTKNHKRIKNKADLCQVEAGHMIFFFCGANPIHAMLSTGNGKAAGNKNDCIGVGSPMVGWEELNLGTNMSWSVDGKLLAPQGITKTNKMVYREIEAYHRPITDLSML